MDNIQPSRVFGVYIIKEKIGSGGMASVYRAINSETETEVALKILHEHYADDAHIRKRLEHEARIVMRLSHPNIVSVLGYGETEKRPYLVMPYMEGGSLAQFFSKPRLVKHETTLKLLVVLAAGLDYAHSQEVVHRDLKLENILLSKNKLPAISDFGIAQSAHTTRITMTGQILGTPQYLAPENLDLNGTLNYRADLYALAVMAYLMLTGYFPFTAKDPLSLAIKHRTETAPPPSLVNQHLPTSIDPIFIRALAKIPDERFTTAKEFVETLDASLMEATAVTTKIFVNDLNPVPATQPLVVSPDSFITRVLPLDNEPIPSVQPPAPIPRPKRSSRALVLPILMLFLCIGATLALYAFNSAAFNGDTIAESTDADASPEASESLVVVATAEATSKVSAQINALRALHNGASASEEATPSETLESDSNAASSASPTRTPRPTITPRRSATATNTPSSTATLNLTTSATPRPTNTPTIRPTNTPAPTNTPRPLPTNTPQPQPTSVPPTNPPAPTAVPPTNPPPPTAVPPTSVPPTNPPPPPPTTILDPILDPVNTLIPCIPIPLVQTCP